MKGHPLFVCADFRTYFLGRVVSAVGDKFYTIALSWWVLSHDGNPGLLLGILMAANILPVVLFGPLAGTLADRWDRRVCMLTANLARLLALSVILLLALLGELSLPLLYLLVFCTSAFTPLFESAATSSIAGLVPREKLAQATAMNASVLQFSNLIGATLGGFFLAIASLEMAIGINVAAFGASFLLIWQIKANLKSHQSGKREPYLRQLLAGFSYLVKENRPIGYILALYALSNFFASSIMFFTPLAVKTLFHQPVTWVAILEGSIAAGFVLVSVALSFVSRGGNVYMRSFLGGWVIFAAFALFLLNSPLLAAAGLFLMGLTIAWSGASMQILFQRTVAAEMKGRFFALMSTSVYIGFPLAFLFNGFLSGIFPLGDLLLFNGLAVLAVTFGFLFIPRVEKEAEGE